MCKSTVHPVFSTSFGLHVAVLTADKPQKFIFTRRAIRGMIKTDFGLVLKASLSCEKYFHV